MPIATRETGTAAVRGTAAVCGTACVWRVLAFPRHGAGPKIASPQIKATGPLPLVPPLPPQRGFAPATPPSSFPLGSPVWSFSKLRRSPVSASNRGAYLDLKTIITPDPEKPYFLPYRIYQAAPGREADLAAELGTEGPPAVGAIESGARRTGDVPLRGSGSPLSPEGPPAVEAIESGARGTGAIPLRGSGSPLSPVGGTHRPFFFAAPKGSPCGAYWWRNVWEEPFVFSFSSIKKAAAVLRSIQRNWVCVPQGYYGRARLIEEELPYIARKRRPLDYKVPDAQVGSWTLIGEHTILASARCASPFPGGIIEFEEDKEGPPSRAYLKLAEAFIRLGTRPVSGETCLDAGASPGGWTWLLSRPTLSRAGVTGDVPPRVIAVDRAPLAPSVAALPNVTFLRHDAFTFRPEDIGAIDWLFCDAACYPERLYGWIEKWLASGLCKNYVCTIKMQDPGKTHNSSKTQGSGEMQVSGGMKTARLFAAIPGGAVVHLYHNKHELTWMRLHR